MIRASLAVLLACFLFLPSKGTASPTLDDPETLYMLTVKSQGLTFPGVKPWHLKASYTLFDAKGKNPVNGVFEEWYVGPHRYKRSYTRPGFTQTDYGTDAGLYRSGEQNWPTRDELQIPINLFEPLPDLQGTKDFTFEKADFTGDVKLRCIVLAHSTGANLVVGVTFPTFCIDPETPVLRLSVPYGASTETIYNRIQVFQNHYVAGELIINIRGKTVFKLAVDSLERLQDPDNAMFTPPSDAVLLPSGPITLLAGSLQTLKSVAVVYPALAKAQRDDGVVRIQFTIDRNGHVATAKITDGPRMMRQATLDAVNQWIFRPFLLSGEPVEVNMVLRIIYNQGR
jgi:TonB family protein